MPIPPQLPFLPTADIGTDSDLVKIFDISDGLEKMVHPEALVAAALSTKQDVLVSGTNIKTINSTSLLGSGNISIAANPAGTAGQIQFSDGSAFAADSNLYWDNTNKRLGVGTSTPASQQEIKGNGDQLWITNSGDIYTYLKFSAQGGFASMIFGDGNGTVNYFNNYATGVWASNKFAFGPSLFTPSGQVHIKGSGSTSATTSLLVQNSSGTQLLKVTDDGVLYNNNLMSTDNLNLGAANSVRYLLTSGQIHPLGNQNFGRDDNLLFLWKNSFFSGYMHITDGTASSSTYNSTAKLQLDSTTKGFLPPRMTTTQKTAISAPASGLQVFDTTTAEQNIYDGSGWRNVIAGDNTNLVWDNTNKRLGVGTNAPTEKITVQTSSAADGISLRDASNNLALIGKWFDSSGFFDLSQNGSPYARIQASQSYLNTPFTIGSSSALSARLGIKGSGSTSATTSLLVQNSSGSTAFQVTDDLVTTTGGSQFNIGSGSGAGAFGIQNAGNSVRLGTTNNHDVGFNGFISYRSGVGYYFGFQDSISPSILTSALVTITSTTKGFLPPRMTTTQKTAISAPASGLQVFDTTTAEQNIYDGSGWRNVIAGDNTNLVWDNTNKRLGVGTSTPASQQEIKGNGDQLWITNSGDIYTYLKFSAQGGFASMIFGDGNGTVNYFNNYATGVWASNKFAFGPSLFTPSGQVHIKGSGSTSATTSLLVQNSSGTELFKVRDDNKVISNATGEIGNLWTFNHLNAWYSMRVGDIGYPPASALCEFKSTTAGVLFPRMTTTQKNAISSPAEGLMVMDITTHKLCVYDGTSWVDLH